jgi:pimeloyl-ACP methyl ester carboxylesterase
MIAKSFGLAGRFRAGRASPSTPQFCVRSGALGELRLTMLLLILLLGCSLSAPAAKHNSIYYEVKGAGRPLVMIHGGQMDRRMWDPQFDRFARQYQIIRYDIRGFGKSDVPLKPYSYTDDLRDLLNHLRLEKVFVLGLSLGSAIAIDFALTQPNRVDGLILACPGLGGFQFSDEAGTRKIVEAARDEGFGRAADLWLEHPFMKPAMQNAALRDQLRRLAHDNGHCWLNNPLLIRRIKPSAAERLADIRAPTLILDGELDLSDIHKIVDKLAAEIPGARKQVIRGAGHIANLEKPEEFNKLALDFLGMLSRISSTDLRRF